MAQSAQERLFSVIDASDAVVSDNGDSEDPVAVRRVSEASARKASALRQLVRFDQAISVWDELIRRFSSEPSPRASKVVLTALFYRARDLERIGRHPECLVAVTELIELSQDLAESGALTLLVVRVLAVRSRVLAALGRVDEAVGSAEEILTRTGQAREPESRQWAAWALEHVSRLLIADGRVDQGLNASVRLEARLLDEPPESLVRVSEILNNHSMLLLQLGAPNPVAVARFILLVLINTSGQAIGHGVSRLTHHLPGRNVRSTGRWHGSSTGRLGVISLVVHSRRRAEQAQAASHAVITKIGSSEDPDLRRCAATAEFITGLATVVLGHPVAGIRAINTFTRRGDLDAIQAFQWVTKRSEQDNSVVSELGNISNAALRARMLGGGDPAITKIAYDDTIADRQTTSAHPTLSRLTARLLRPKIDKTPMTDPRHEPSG